MHLEELVSKNLARLNPTDLAIWQYIAVHKESCRYISIYNLALACNVSRTTILRFAKKLGFDGFSDLKAVLKIEGQRKDAYVAANIAQATIQLCRNVGEEMARQNFGEANRLLFDARRIFVYASGSAQRNVANELVRMFKKAGVFISRIYGTTELDDILPYIVPEDDLFVIISLSGESEHVLSFAEALYARGVPFISLTRLKTNRLAHLATERLYVTSDTLPTAGAITYQSFLAFFLMVEVWFISYTQFLNQAGCDISPES